LADKEEPLGANGNALRPTRPLSLCPFVEVSAGEEEPPGVDGDALDHLVLPNHSVRLRFFSLGFNAHLPSFFHPVARFDFFYFLYDEYLFLMFFFLINIKKNL
jgi:hypothetical protein